MIQSHTRIAVIMAGGAGERFWPLSRQARPKQLLKLTNPELTLLEEAVQRIKPLIPLENIYVATSLNLVEPISAAALGLPAANILGEPCKRNTAGCLAYAAAVAQARHGGERVTLAILTADHTIGDADQFRATVAAALDAAEREQALVTIGVTPDRVETGYGYIEVAEKLPAARPTDTVAVVPVVSFHEKPNEARAREFVAGGRHYWNSGMFFWTLEAFNRELADAAPGHAQAVGAMTEAMQARNDAGVEAAFAALPDISIDYALMEKAQHVLMARATFPWDDVGAWDALERSFARDANGNVAIGDPVLIDARNNIVYNEPGGTQMAVAAIGVEDLIVVVSRDGVLIAPKHRAQEVKKAVAELKQRGAAQL